MCLAVRSDQHIQLLFVYEQMWPRLKGDRLAYEECYDLIIRSFSKEPLAHLHVLSPFEISHTHATFDQVADTGKFDWIFTREPKEVKRLSDDNQIYEVNFRAEASDGQNRFRAMRLKPALRRLDLAKADPYHVAAIVGTGMTVADLDFSGGPLILPYDDKHPDATTYWIRLTFTASREGSPTATFGPDADNPLFRVMPCAVFSPDEVVSDLDSRLDLLTKAPSISAGASKAKVAIIDGLLRKLGSSVQIFDHRISIVTGQQRVLVLNTHHEGACSYSGVSEVIKTRPYQASTEQPEKKMHLARNYFTGAAFFAGTDALTLAGQALGYLRTFAGADATSKTKEEITSAIGAVSHANVGHVIDVLKGFDFVHELRNRFFVDDKCRPGDLDGPGAAGPELLSELYMPRTEKRGFAPRGYRIDFDFAFA